MHAPNYLFVLFVLLIVVAGFPYDDESFKLEPRAKHHDNCKIGKLIAECKDSESCCPGLKGKKKYVHPYIVNLLYS